MPSIKGNIILNGINTVTGIIFPVITFPYAARVLLPDGIGAVNFLNSIVSYIVLLTSLGIPMYAVKEVAKYRDDKEKRDRITVEIFILSTILCILGYIAVWTLAKFVPQIHEQSALFYILSLSILFNAIGVGWFYQGIEDFKFITIRGIIIRTLAAVSLFVFVKDSSDLLIYGLVVVGSTVGNSILNFSHLRKYINLWQIKWKNLKIIPHLKPSLQVFILNLIISLYIQLNSIMLGFMAGDVEIGYFAAGTKISHIGITMVSSLSAVLLPRCSNFIQTGDINGFNSIISKSLNVTLAMVLPMMVGLIILATPLTLIFCGSDYMASIPVLILNAPVIVFVSLTSVTGLQVLYPMDKINIVIWSSVGGALSNFILNLIFIPLYGATGAAISTLVTEFTVFLVQMILGRRYLPFTFKDIINYKYIMASAIMGILTFLSIQPFHEDSIKLIAGIGIGFITYCLLLMVLKDSLIIEIKKFILMRWRSI